MAKSHKRQRVQGPLLASKRSKKIEGDVILGPKAGVSVETEKDDEERRLESMLFGVPYVPARRSDKRTGYPEEIVDLTKSGMEHLQDEDLFFIDENSEMVGRLPSVDIEAAAQDAADELDAEMSTGDQEDEMEEEFRGFESESGSDDRGSTPSSPTSTGSLQSLEEDQITNQPQPLNSSTVRKPAVWVDEDDNALRVSLADNKRLRKLREAPAEDEVSGKVYETRLRRQYEKVNPAPGWATTHRARLKKPESDDEVDSLFKSTGDVIASEERGGRLPSGELQVERLRDANQAGKSTGEIKAVMFHPSLPVLLTAGADRRLRLFNVDGHSNPLLQTVHVPDLPLTRAVFHPTGSSILLTGPRPFYYAYDLQSGAIQRSPRGLWGSSGSNSEAADRSMEICQFSPDGRLLAIGGRRGNISFLDWRSGGTSGQIIGGVKMNSAVKSVQWSVEGREMISLGEDAEAYVWDVRSRRCLRKWSDDSGFGPTALEISRDNQYMALGSSTGIVNLYGASAMTHGPSATGNPKALKTIMNLTTSISCLRFNPDGQILGLASKLRKDELRMLHLPSNTVFYNWPTSGTPLGHVTSMDFSSSSEYVSISNSRGKVLLYQLPHYIN